MLLRSLIVALLLATPVYADVVKVEVKSRADVVAGKTFGAAGPYEKIVGTVHFADWTAYSAAHAQRATPTAPTATGSRP